ncbi:hypothetical protein HQ865_23410 [Mucilaginibacter mali]|uniref:Uncharacterized protein n=1 Tax=Mucilaginibacter mali TaxID=2740462 RepID=A0A7D4QCV0_9SPHI|nr:hypothetical protein [Mucilaginibacter mali]QKJ32585.1 hypothetical protein HQ865_23410 [Mucilaginibacter mali]
MKTYTAKTAPSKLVAKFDQQLMDLLMEDLKAFRAKNNNIRKVGEQQQLIAA